MIMLYKYTFNTCKFVHHSLKQWRNDPSLAHVINQSNQTINSPRMTMSHEKHMSRDMGYCNDNETMQWAILKACKSQPNIYVTWWRLIFKHFVKLKYAIIEN